MNECVKSAKSVGKCAYCGRPAQYISLTFMTHICSVLCDDAYTDEYFEATMSPDTFKEALEAFQILRERLKEERRKRVQLEQSRTIPPSR